MILGFMVLVCTAIGCIAAVFAGLFLRRKWVLAVPVGLLVALGCHYAFGLSPDWGDEFFWEQQARTGALALIPILFAAWLSARLGRKLLQENL